MSFRLVPRSLLACLVASAASIAQAQQPIEWRTNAPNAMTQVVPGSAQLVLDLTAARPDANHVVLQFERPVNAHTKSRLRAAGVELLRPLGSDAWFAAVVPRRFDSNAVAGIRELTGAQEIRPEWKLHPLLTEPVPPTWSIVGIDPGGGERIAVYVVLHADVELETGGRDLARDLGGEVRDVLESVNGLVLELPRARLGDLATADAVQWVEPPLPPLSDVNDSNTVLIQADVVQAAPYDLDGTGVTVLVYDGGTARDTHQDFGGRATARDASGLSNHSTHVAGTIGGDGSASGGTFAGMAPGVTIESYGFEYDGTSIFLYTNPGDIETDYDEAINTFGADISNNSIGTNTETNGFPCNLQGDYGVTANLIDAIVRGSLGSPFRIVWANGNERQGSRCDLEGFGDYYSTAPPATAKNHITIGALNSNDDSMTSFSSWGPTDDGRIKPDVSAPGCQSSDDFGVTSTGSASDSSYSTLCGTSMAAPTATGACALLLEDYRAQFGGPDPRNSTLKALLAQAAFDGGNVGPDYQFGYGSIRIQDTIDFMRLGNFREDALDDSGASFAYTLNVPPATPQLEVTLAWDDAPGTPNVLGSLVNDLDLVVVDPLGTRHYPWTLDPSDPAAPAVRVEVDRVNNIEQVTVDLPAAGTWRVEVRAHDLPDGPQVYSIAASEALAVGPFVQIGFPNGLPEALTPGVATNVDVSVTGVGDTVVGGTPTLHYRYDGGSILTQALLPLGGDLYQATLPPPVCGATPEYWFSAEGATSGAVSNPEAGALAAFASNVHTTQALFTDDFEVDLGWSVVNEALDDGPWERGVPAGDGGRNDPLVDFDGSGQCWLTDNLAGNSDVDGGPTRLVSPAIDLAAASDPSVRYAVWFANDDFDIDDLVVEVSDDGGSNWATVETIVNTSGWTTRSFRVLDHVALTANTVVRFSVTDNPNDSVTEAAFDAFVVEDTICAGGLADCNGNGILDADDVTSGRAQDCDGNGVPDSCQPDSDGDGVIDPCETGGYTFVGGRQGQGPAAPR